MHVFLSYRRGDVGGYAGRLSDALKQRLGAKGVFQDVRDIAPGEDFTKVIDRALDDCDAVLAVIGPNWVGASTPQGGPRLFETDDYVRLELVRALHRNIPVVPVLVGGASLPAASDVPDELGELAQRQAVVLHDATWHQDVEGLLRSLRGKPEAPSTGRRRWLVAGSVAVVLLASAAAVWWFGPGNDQAGSSAEPPPCAPPNGAGWRSIVLGNDPVGEETTPNGSLVFTVKDARWRAHDHGWEVSLKTTMENATSTEAYQYVWRYRSLIVGKHSFAPACFSPTPEAVDPRTAGDGLVGFETTCKPVGYIELVIEDDSARISVSDPTLEPGAC